MNEDVKTPQKKKLGIIYRLFLIFLGVFLGVVIGALTVFHIMFLYRVLPHGGL